MPQFEHFDDVRTFAPADGVRMRSLFGEGAMLNLVEIEPGGVVPLHSHPHEQLGLVLEGELILEVEGVEHRLGPNHVYQLEGGVTHEGRSGPDGCTVLDVFQPVREDYRELAG